MNGIIKVTMLYHAGLVGKQGGLSLDNVIFEEKNFKIGFLSDQMVPATPKYISG